MAEPVIRFEDGGLYERTMGVWSRFAGEAFLDWLAPPSGLRWIDVGCGSGAFTELLMRRCAPAEIHGVDPSPQQLDFARGREGACGAVFTQGDAQSLPFEADRFDAAVMALVLFFVPDPPRGLAEMVRVTLPGGLVSAYLWDILEGGFPFRFVSGALRDRGYTVPVPPSVGISRAAALRDLWQQAGLAGIRTHAITVERTYPDFDAFWAINTAQGSTKAALAAVPPEEVARIREEVRARLPADAGGHITVNARANAICGHVPT